MKNKFMSLMSMGVLLGSTILPVCAADSTQQTATVKYSNSYSYTVTIPSEITLDTDTKSGKYDITVSGNISTAKKVTVTPFDEVSNVDGVNIAMKLKGGTNADMVAATITQPTDWSATEVSAKTVKQGSISAPNLSYGDWEGTITFDITLADK